MKPAYLPDSDAERTDDKAAEVREVNKVVFGQLHVSKNRKGPSIHNYYGPESLQLYQLQKLGKPVCESTICGTKKAYYLVHKKDGKPESWLENGL